MLFRRKNSVTPADAARAAAAGELQLIDVRDADEVAKERVEHAAHIPFADLAQRIGELDRALPVAFLCRSGVRSDMATKIARKEGIEAVNVDGGVIAWRRHGLPLEEGQQ